MAGRRQLASQFTPTAIDFSPSSHHLLLHMSGSSVVIFPQSDEPAKKPGDPDAAQSDIQPLADARVKVKIHEESFQRLIEEVEDYAIILLDKNGIIVT